MVKNKIITTRTTEDLYHRFTKICEKKGWKGDDWIVMFIGKFEDDQGYINSQISLEKMKLRKILKSIQDLENERISCESTIEELNSKVVDQSNTAVEKAVDVILQRYHRQSVYDILDFLNLKENKVLLENQAYLAGISEDDLYMMVFNKS